MEKLLEEISFEGPDLEPKHQRIDAAYVSRQCSQKLLRTRTSAVTFCEKRRHTAHNLAPHDESDH